MQLFHLDQDLGESKDLASAAPDRAASLKKKLTDYLADVKAQLPLRNPDYASSGKSVSDSDAKAGKAVDSD